MSNLEKLIIYESDGWVGFCRYKDWERYRYENQITPKRMSLITATQDCIETLFDLADNDKEQFIEIIREELSTALTLYSN